MQITLDELIEDVDFIVQQLMHSRNDFKIYVAKLIKDQSFVAIVSKTIGYLLSEKEESTVSVEIKLICDILEMWLTLYFCKKLLQVMTPQSLTQIHARKWHHYYLMKQSHFSLKKMISKMQQPIQNV